MIPGSSSVGVDLAAGRWQAVKEILNDALDHHPSERARFVDFAATDPDIRSEVLSLLSDWNDAELWFERAAQAVADIVSGPAFHTGQILAGRYEIQRFIARGGMGEVYEAEDRDLSGSVALKVLRPSLAFQPGVADRFRREIQLGRTINSPFVCRVHDIEYHRCEDAVDAVFYTMELLAGDTLAARLRAGPLSLAEARPIIRCVALGLDAAHRLGIAHRDFKPGNVILTPSGAVITDFGLALDIAADPDGFAAATPGYASPEQLAGRTQTTATDIYSLGVVIREMLGPDASLPSIVHQCLADEPAARPASAVLVAKRLGAIDSPFAVSRRTALAASGTAAGVVWLTWRFVPRPTPIDPSPFLAILPVQSAPSSAFMAAGVSDRLTDVLSRVPGLRILTRGSVAKLGASSDPAAARNAGLSHVIASQLTEQDSMYRLSLQLASTRDGSQVWSTTLDSDASLVVTSTGDLARSIIKALKIENVPATLTDSPASSQPEALQAWLLGRFYAARRDTASLVESVRLLEKAVALDPAFSDGWSALAMSRYYIASKDDQDTRAAVAACIAAASRALTLNPENAEALLALGSANYLYLWNWSVSEQNLKKAIRLRPGLGNAHHMFALLLSSVRRYPEALVEIDRAVELDPFASISKSARGTILRRAGRLREAVAQYRAVLAEDPSFVNARNQLAEVLGALGQWDQALVEAKLTVESSHRASFALTGYGYVLGKIGRREEALAIARELTDRNGVHQAQPSFVAEVWLGLGDIAQSIAWLNKGFSAMDPNISGLATSIIFAELSSNPEVQSMIHQLKL